MNAELHDRSEAIRSAVAIYRYALAGDSRSMRALLWGTSCHTCLLEEILKLGLLFASEQPLTDDGQICDEDKAGIDELLARMQWGFARVEAGLDDEDGE